MNLNLIVPNAPIPAGMSTGLELRNFKSFPTGCYAAAPEFPASEVIDQSEWADRLNENRKNKAGLLDLREDNYEILKSLNQNGLGLCWAFSTTKAAMYLRKVMNAPDVILSAWYVAGMIKGWRDQGGWGAASLQFAADKGIPSMAKCPTYSSKYATSDVATDALTHRITEWFDGSESPATAQKQLISMLLKGIPCVVDLNDMGHSMCAIDIASLNPIQIVYDNSWGEGTTKGLYIGQGPRARPDGLVIPRVSLAT